MGRIEDNRYSSGYRRDRLWYRGSVVFSSPGMRIKDCERPIPKRTSTCAHSLKRDIVQKADRGSRITLDLLILRKNPSICGCANSALAFGGL